MCAAYCQLHPRGVHLSQHCSRSPQLLPLQRVASRSTRRHVPLNNWKVWGPTAEYSDGDAEFFSVTNRLTDQYEWFAPKQDVQEPEPSEQVEEDKPPYGLTPKEIAALGLSGPRTNIPDSSTLSSRAYMRGYTAFDPSDPASLSFSAVTAAAASSSSSYQTTGRRYQAPRAAIGDYAQYPEGRPIFLPEAERYGNPPDLPSLLLQQRIIYISMPFLPSVTELVVAQCYYLDFDDKNRQKPIYVYLNSTGCINDKNQAISADNEFYAIWAALGFTRAPLYTGVTWKAQNQAAVLLAAGQKGHRYSFPHAKISTSPPIMNRVFGQSVDAQLQSNELEYATKYYAAILARSTGKDLATCQKEYLSRRRYFSVKEAYEEGLVDKLIPGYKLNRFRKIVKDNYGNQETFFNKDKPKFRFTRKEGGSS
eukprot:jgi/Chrzof1/8627/Cz03g18040.t1_CLP1